MLRTNSKQAREKIRGYIVKGVKDCDYIKGETFEEVAPQIAKAFYEEKIKYIRPFKPIFEYFVDWCQGLPSAINCDYYYNVDAVKLLGDLLEETEEERAKYTQRESEEMLTYLIFKELSAYIYNIIK